MTTSFNLRRLALNNRFALRIMSLPGNSYEKTYTRTDDTESRLRKNSVRSLFALRNDLPDALVPSPTHSMSE
jgi:hypothetical protein